MAARNGGAEWRQETAAAAQKRRCIAQRRKAEVAVTRRSLIAVCIVALVVSVFVADGRVRAWWPGLGTTVRLGLLLFVTRLLGLGLEAVQRQRRPVVIYEDYLVDWAWFGVLALVAMGAHAVVERLVGGPVGPVSIALGVYALSRILSKRSLGGYHS
jgi:Ca2+/Na+ antiporter